MRVIFAVLACAPLTGRGVRVREALGQRHDATRSSKGAVADLAPSGMLQAGSNEQALFGTARDSQISKAFASMLAVADEHESGFHIAPYGLTIPARAQRSSRSLTPRLNDDDAPSDMDEEFIPEATSDVDDDLISDVPSDVDESMQAPKASTASSARIPELKTEFLLLAASTSRGAVATDAQKSQIADIISEMESANPTPDTSADGKLDGTWELVYGTEDAYRSSPFFWAFRNALDGTSDPRDSSNPLADAIFQVTDSIPMKTIGVAKQTISGSVNYGAGSLVSEVQLYLGTQDDPNFFGFAGFGSKSLMTTTSEIISSSGNEMMLEVQKTQVRESTPQKTFGLPLDAIEFPSRDALDAVKAGSAQVRMVTTFLDSDLRITRNDFGQTFVFRRA